MTRRSLALASMLALGAGVGWIQAGTTLAATREKVVESLMTSYNGESNATARYLAFAKKADDEGYGAVASLFRAAAKAEEIHAENQAMALRGLNEEPKADVKTIEVKSTRENLNTAITGETYERDVMYPKFLAIAQEFGNDRVIRSIKLALTAEVEHAKLYQDALNNLESWKGGKRTFYVCEVCGYTTASISGLKACPACSSDKEMFLAIK